MRFDLTDEATWPEPGEYVVQLRSGKRWCATFSAHEEWGPRWHTVVGHCEHNHTLAVTDYAELPSFETPAEDAEDVQVAVAMTPDGRWAAWGHGLADDDVREEQARKLLLEPSATVMWLGARIAPPEVVVVVGEVAQRAAGGIS